MTEAGVRGPWERMQARIEEMPPGPDRTQALVDLNAMLTDYNTALRASVVRSPEKADAPLREAVDAWMRFARHAADRKWTIPLWGALLWEQAIAKSRAVEETAATSHDHDPDLCNGCRAIHLEAMGHAAELSASAIGRVESRPPDRVSSVNDRMYGWTVAFQAIRQSTESR